MNFKRKAKYKPNNVKKQTNQKLKKNENKSTKGIHMIHSISDENCNQTNKTSTRI